MQPLFPISPPSKNLYQTKFAYTCICTDPIKRQRWGRHNSGIQSRIPCSVSAVTNTHSQRRCSGRGEGGWGKGVRALSLEQITFKPKRKKRGGNMEYYAGSIQQQQQQQQGQLSQLQRDHGWSGGAGDSSQVVSFYLYYFLHCR